MHRYLFIVVTLLCISGCVYKRDIYQGNILPQENISQVKKGMTQEEVSDILGHPVLDSAFDVARDLYYVEFTQPGKCKGKGKTLHLYFKDNKLIDIKEKAISTPVR